MNTSSLAHLAYSTSATLASRPSQPNYCVLPSQHEHQEAKFSPDARAASLLDGFERELDIQHADEDTIILAFARLGSLPASSQLLSMDSFVVGPTEKLGVALQPKVLAHFGQEAQGVQKRTEQVQPSQALDPYIDAVQVKSRVNNKRGPRVRAALVPQAQRIVDLESKASYYHKSVHSVVEGGHQYEWDSSDDDDDDDDDLDSYDGDHFHQHGHKLTKYSEKDGGKQRKKKRKRKKRIYVKLGGHHVGPRGYQSSGHKYQADKKKRRKKKKTVGKKKKVYKAYLYKPVKKSYEKGHHDEHHDYQHDHEHHYYHPSSKYSYHDDKYGDKHVSVYQQHKPGKLIHLDVLSAKGKGMSVAGLLGYTLLCVNYLLVLQQPHYDQYSGHHYTKYSPHSSSDYHTDHKSPLSLKAKHGSGPVILAHCADLPGPVQVPLSTKLAKQMLTSTQSYSTAAASPPAYYYTLSPSHIESTSDEYQLVTTRRAGSGLQSPIQNYLNRLLLPTTSTSTANTLLVDDYNSQDLVDNQYAPIRVVGNPRRRPASAARLTNSNLALVNRPARVVLLDGQPQVVSSRDNLMDMRERQVPVEVHVIRQRFSGPARSVQLEPDRQDWSQIARGPNDSLGVQVPVAVRAPSSLAASGRMLADQPTRDQRRTSNSSGELTNNQMLELPEYALSGDSIELTCRHRMSVSRLYSVKWFKDSLEFYRFIPANGARSKSSLFLPDVHLDLARSNSELLYLRNVTHRTSGLYRCEVVSGKFAGELFQLTGHDKAA